jgi:hypothetical protein
LRCLRTVLKLVRSGQAESAGARYRVPGSRRRARQCGRLS